MDGVYSGNLKHLFLLTTNETYINDNFLSRPGRILYFRTYSSLREETVRAYVSDTLHDQSKLEEVINAVDSLEIITIDILKCIVEELNTTNIDVVTALSYLNVKKAAHHYDADILTLYGNNPAYNAYNEERFLRELQLNGQTYLDADGRELTYWFSIDHSVIPCSHKVATLKYNDKFGWGRVIKPLSKNNIILMEGDNGQRIWCRINNPDSVFHNFSNSYLNSF